MREMCFIIQKTSELIDFDLLYHTFRPLYEGKFKQFMNDCTAHAAGNAVYGKIMQK